MYVVLIKKHLTRGYTQRIILAASFHTASFVVMEGAGIIPPVLN
jgi:hypothetical protein